MTTNTLVSSAPDFAQAFRRAAGFLPSGVAVLFSGDVAMTVSSLQCVSFEPPMVSVALSRDSRKGAAILASGRFHARLLRSGEEAVSRGEQDPSGPGMLEMECAIAQMHPAGDHVLALAGVEKVRASAGNPIIYWRRGFHAFCPHYKFLETQEALAQFVTAWETGTLPKAQWTHAAHVAVGSYYAVLEPVTAFERTKNGIWNYNKAVGTPNTDNSGYHETLTRFWAGLLTNFVKGLHDPWEAARAAVERFGEERDLHSLYYSFDVVKSVEARRKWIAPDRKGPYEGAASFNGDLSSP